MKFKLKININLKGYWEMVGGFGTMCSRLLESAEEFHRSCSLDRCCDSFIGEQSALLHNIATFCRAPIEKAFLMVPKKVFLSGRGSA